uniref:Kringle domain-containing protein n=1 Tax=Macrostomum lignano TaxID=282301 RepID=A0A1I8GPM0_9PLAT
MGSVRTSRSGRTCQPWQALVNGSLSTQFRNLDPVMEFRVFLPDPESVANVGSDCRSAAVMYRDPRKGLGWRPITELIIDGQVTQEPWCLVEKPGYKNLTMESCSVPDCSSSLKCISGLLHQKYGPHVLSKLVGPSLDVTLLDCSFGDKKCTPADFTALHHPYYGACYKFNSAPFLRDLTPMQHGLRPLSLKLFADDHDYLGNRRPDTFTAVRAVMGGPYNLGEASDPAGFNLIVMPPGAYPGTSHAIPIYTGARSTVRISYFEDTDNTTRGFCNPLKSSTNYSIYSWSPTVLRPRYEQSFSMLDPYFL